MLEIEQWLENWQRLGVGASSKLRALYDDVLGRYSERQRRYHTAQHLAECLEKVARITALAEHPAEIYVGLWFHDAFYDPRRSDNEERSARWLRSVTLKLGVDADGAQRLHELVMCTRHAEEPTGTDAQILVDADLSILGAPPERFREYEEQVRWEDDWVPDAAFRKARSKILKGFLDRRSIFHTPVFQALYEMQARHNLRQSLLTLDAPYEATR